MLIKATLCFLIAFFGLSLMLIVFMSNIAFAAGHVINIALAYTTIRTIYDVIKS